MRDVNGVCYPHEYPKWRTVHAYYLQWSKTQDGSATSLLEQVLKKLVGEVRAAQDRKAQTSFCIIDAESVKNTDTAQQHVIGKDNTWKIERKNLNFIINRYQ